MKYFFYKTNFVTRSPIPIVLPKGKGDDCPMLLELVLVRQVMLSVQQVLSSLLVQQVVFCRQRGVIHIRIYAEFHRVCRKRQDVVVAFDFEDNHVRRD